MMAPLSTHSLTLMTLIILLSSTSVFPLLRKSDSFTEEIFEIFDNYLNASSAKDVETRAEKQPCTETCPAGHVCIGDSLGCPKGHWCLYKQGLFGPDSASVFACIGASNCGTAEGYYTVISPTKCCYTPT